MGTYCELYIADYPVLSSKSYVLPVVMTLFRESDKRIFERKLADRNKIEPGHRWLDEDETEIAVEYRALVKHVLQRLDVMGFTLHHAKQEFEEEKLAEVNKIKEYVEEEGDFDLWRGDIEVLQTYSFEDYLDAFKTILSSGIHPVYYLKDRPDASNLIRYILDDGMHEVFYWGFPCSDIRCFFRALLEVAARDSFVVQDITDLVDAGYYDREDNVCEQSLRELVGDYPINSKIIVLTEGSTDKEVIESSLKLLYPHLCEYYSFMDFGMRPTGGVGPLVNAVKSFAGAGIKNRIIALFDNDTAAFSAVKTLKNLDIPANIVIRHYPDIRLAQNYPALGPNGIVHQDINGLACSIELYFGKDILEIDGKLTPIEWKALEPSLGRYQGEIKNKSVIKQRFLEKISRCQKDYSAINDVDWSGIESILLKIFEAFNA